MRCRHVLLATLMACAVSTPLAATASMAAPSAKPAVTHGKSTTSSHGKPTKPAKPAKTVKVTATGTLTAVDATGNTITVTIKGGSKDLRASSTIFTVLTGIRITRDDTPATVADLQPGDHVSVQGQKSNAGYKATRINAESPQPDPSSSTNPEPDPSSSSDPQG
jgi:hypothetical protein